MIHSKIVVWRWVAVTRLLATTAPWVRIQTSPKKYYLGNISKGVDNTLWPAKKYLKKIVKGKN